MRFASIRILDRQWEKIRDLVITPDSFMESVVFVTASYHEFNEFKILIVDDIIPAAKDDYIIRTDYRLEVSPLYVNKAINYAERQGNTIIMIHSHPFDEGVPSFSLSDDFGEARTSETISKCLDNSPPVGSLVIGQNSLSARTWLGQYRKFIPTSVNIIGRQFKFYPQRSHRSHKISNEIFDRQILAIGSLLQTTLRHLKIGIVGLGGTGSSIAEQLVRMGIESIKLVDHDTFEPSNLSRLFGSFWNDVTKSQFKVDIVTSHLKKITPDLNCHSMNKSVITRDVLDFLTDCDIIFSCLDRHAPRSVLNELSYQYYIPIIDVGAGIVKQKEGNIFGGAIRASIIGPTLPCFFCQDIIRPDIIMAEHLDPEEYRRRKAEGYVDEMDENAPSIISYTNAAASLGIIVFMEMLSTMVNRYTTIAIDFSMKDIFTIKSKIKHNCICKKITGKGSKRKFSVAD